MTTQSNLGLLGNWNINGTVAPAIYTANGPPPASSLFGQFTIGSSWFDKSAQIMYVFYGQNTWKQISNAGSSGGPITWVSVSSTQSTSPNLGYLVTSGSSAIVLYLPLTAPVGSQLFFQGVSTTVGPAPAFPGFVIGQNAGQQILQNNVVATTMGSAGSLATTHQGAELTLTCVQANNLWNITNTNFVSFIPS